MDDTWTKITDRWLPGHGNLFWCEKTKDKESLDEARFFSFQVKYVYGIVP